MPVVKRFTQAQWDAASRRLEALPEKPAHEHHVNVRDAVKAMRSQITGAQQKGYTLDEIVAQLARDGVEISASTLRYAIRCAAAEGAPATAEKHISPPTSSSAPLPRAGKSGRSGRPRVEGVARESGESRGKADSRPGSMVMRDAFSFEITPDTENL
ncbi:hypothetical protein [Paraburkholderia kururiensis]|uniref:hypothetical protein n=1 Tax=Paraburkholderia kururiensis TaxID=984307 RepID=UPI0018F325DE|nr:hypothetical protein [Paraburkholderia kururiensis]